MITLPELVTLLYRADADQLSLAARITWHQDGAVQRLVHERKAAAVRQRLPAGPLRGLVPDASQWTARDTDEEWQILLAPGGRYRVESADGEVHAICDGTDRWTRLPGLDRGRAAEQFFHGLLSPGWLLASCDLELPASAELTPGTERAGVAGPTVSTGPGDPAGPRPAWRVTGTPRGVCERGLKDEDQLMDRIEVSADAGLGILLRAERLLDGATMTVAQLHDLVLSPPRGADPALFQLPDASAVRRGPWPDGASRSASRGAHAADTAAGAAAAAMGFAARHAPRKQPRRDPGDAEAAMPSDVRQGPASAEVRTPVSSGLIALLQRAGLPAQALAAEFHQWIDPAGYIGALEGARDKLPPVLDGILGPDALWEGIARHAAADLTEHRVAGLRVALPGRYRLDYRSSTWKTRASAVACDGTTARRLFRDRVTVGPPVPVPKEVAQLLDPAWLLSGWALTEAGPAEVAGRAGLRVVAEPGRRFETGLATVAEAIVDPELGILLRFTAWARDRPLERAELRAVAPGDPAPGPGSDAVFGAGLGAGLREVPDSPGSLGERDLPASVQQAGTAAALAAGGLAAGAVAVTGWLEKHRSRRRPPSG